MAFHRTCIIQEFFPYLLFTCGARIDVTCLVELLFLLQPAQATGVRLVTTPQPTAYFWPCPAVA